MGYIGYFYPEEMPESTDDTECYFSEHRGHRNNVEIATKYQRKPDSIPFPSVVYIKGHEESLETIKRKWKMQRNKMLKFFVLFASVDRAYRMMGYKINPAKFRKENKEAKKLLQEEFGLNIHHPLKVIILEKRKLIFLRSVLKKCYDFAYRKIQYGSKD